MISWRQWNRTVLERQHLLARVDEDAIDVIDRVVGLQSQDPQAAHLGLACRIAFGDPYDLDDLLLEREVVRTTLLRGTVHVMDAEDARWMRALLQPFIAAQTRTNHHAKLRGADPADVVAAGRDALAGRSLAVGALGAALAERWPDEDRSHLTNTVRGELMLVQVPPRGLWRRSGQATYRLFDEWVGEREPAVEGDEAKADLVRMYLRGFGPSTVKAIVRWSGVTGLAGVVDAMGDELTVDDGPDGRVLVDLAGLELADPDRPAPARLLAPFDNVVVAQEDRARIVDEDVYRRLSTANGRFPGFVLSDGRVVGAWTRRPGGGVDVEYLTDVSTRARREVAEETEVLAAYLAIAPR